MDKTCPMHEVRETIRYLNEGHARDKVVITVLLSRYESQTTKSPELIFSALVGDDGTHNVRFERALRT